MRLHEFVGFSLSWSNMQTNVPSYATLDGDCLRLFQCPRNRPTEFTTNERKLCITNSDVSIG